MKTRIQQIRERVDGETMRPEHRKDISDLLAVVEVLEEAMDNILRHACNMTEITGGAEQLSVKVRAHEALTKAQEIFSSSES